MKIVKNEEADKIINSKTSELLEYSINQIDNLYDYYLFQDKATEELEDLVDHINFAQL